MSLVVQKRQNGRHACERCRAAKARCVTDTLQEHGRCRKCQAADVPCEWKAISKTRTRKRTDVRVSELEKQLSSLTAALNSQNNTMSAEASTTEAAESEINIVRTSPTRAPITPQLGSALASYHHASHEAVDTRNIIVPHLSPPATNSLPEHCSVVSSPKSSPHYTLSIESKKKAIEAFVLHLLPQCPVVAVPADVQLTQLEASNPFMTKAIIAAGCSISQSASFSSMHYQNIVELSQAVMIDGQKSLDLVQALLISSIWCHPPENLSNLNIYQWTHMACTMALELGLGGRASVHASQQDVTAFSQDASNSNMERYRTMFGIYIMCSRLAISLRRQRMISFSHSTSTAVNLFQQNAQSIDDRRLVAWLRLQSIAENIESMKQNAEIRADPFFLDSSSVRSDISLFFDRLKTWEDLLDPVLWTVSLRIDLAFCKSKLYELSIYYGRNVQQLDIPALADSSDRTLQEQEISISPGYIRALLSFVTGCQSILQSFLDASPEALRALPMITMFRVPYAFKALAMLRAKCREPGTAIGQIINEDTIKFDFYAGQIFRDLENASAGGLYVFPNMALSIRESATRDQTIHTFEGSIMGDDGVGMFPEQPFDSIPELFFGGLGPMSQLVGAMQPSFTSNSYMPSLAGEDNGVWRYGFPGL